MYDYKDKIVLVITYSDDSAKRVVIPYLYKSGIKARINEEIEVTLDSNNSTFISFEGDVYTVEAESSSKELTHWLDARNNKTVSLEEYAEAKDKFNSLYDAEYERAIPETKADVEFIKWYEELRPIYSDPILNWVKLGINRVTKLKVPKEYEDFIESDVIVSGFAQLESYPICTLNITQTQIKALIEEKLKDSPELKLCSMYKDSAFLESIDRKYSISFRQLPFTFTGPYNQCVEKFHKIVDPVLNDVQLRLDHAKGEAMKPVTLYEVVTFLEDLLDKKNKIGSNEIREFANKLRSNVGK
jgi:hypothetical protein